MTTTAEKARHLGMLHYRMAQVADLQRQRRELDARRDSGMHGVAHGGSLKGAEQPVDLALQFAKLDSALRFARLALAQILDSLPAAERIHFIRACGPRPAERAGTPRSHSQPA